MRCFRLTSIALALVGVGAAPLMAAPASKVEPAAVVAHYGELGAAIFGDALKAALDLQGAVNALVANPSEATLAAAREAWIAARKPYMQSEPFRFGNAVVDDWEGKVNSWPLDEGLIDYVAAAYGTENPENQFYAANIIARTSIMIAGQEVDTSKITKTLLSETLQEAGGVESNVATGYHAVEFLLWGQDLNGTGPGAGNRPFTDFDSKACTGGHCDRRVAYLVTVTDLLVDDLGWMAAQWAPGGAAREVVTKDAIKGVGAIFTGLGSLSYGELAGERMKVSLIVHDPEQEHDCFSDNTHNSHHDDAIGIQNIYLGRYKRLDGTVLAGPSVSDLVAAAAPDTDKAIRAAIDTTVARMATLVERAKTVEAYDQMIAQDNAAGNATVQAGIDALIAQAKELERGIAALDLKGVHFVQSESLGGTATERK